MVLPPSTSSDSSGYINEIRNIQSQINHLLEMQKKGIVESVDVVIQELTKKEFKLKEQEVLKVHTNAFDSKTRDLTIEEKMGTSGYLKIVPFSAKEKSPEISKSQDSI